MSSGLISLLTKFWANAREEMVRAKKNTTDFFMLMKIRYWLQRIWRWQDISFIKFLPNSFLVLYSVMPLRIFPGMDTWLARKSLTHKRRWLCQNPIFMWAFETLNSVPLWNYQSQYEDKYFSAYHDSIFEFSVFTAACWHCFIINEPGAAGSIFLLESKKTKYYRLDHVRIRICRTCCWLGGGLRFLGIKQ